MWPSKFSIPREMVPISGLNPYFQYVSSARQVMFTGNLTQMNVLDGATRKRQRSGLEKQHARGTFKPQFKRDAIVKAVISRFTNDIFGNDFALNPLDVVIIEDYQTGELDVIELPRFHVMHQHYGFRFKYDEDVYEKLFEPKARFKAGTIIANSPSVTPDGDYMYGLETNVIMISDPATTEDGVVFSRSYTKRITTTGYESRTFSCGRSHYPTNVNGNGEVFKAIPDIGDNILGNGLICALRPFDPMMDPIYMSAKKMFKPVYNMDVPYYGIPNARVVDIKVMHNDQFDGPKLPEEMSAQFRKYYEADKRFYTEIIRTCLGRQGRGLSEDVKLSKRLWALLYEAISRTGEDLVDEGLWPKEDIARLRAQKNYRGETMDEWVIEVIYEYKTNMGEGPKVTDLAGGKGVGVAVWEDEDMPVDEFGNRAEVAIFHGGTVNRMNDGRTHEQAVGAAGRDVIKRIRRSYGFPDMGPISDKVVRDRVYGDEELSRKNFEYLMGFYKLVTPNNNFAKLNKPETYNSGRWLKHLVSVIHDGDEPYGLYLQIPSDSGVYMEEVIRELDTGKYRPEMSPVTFRAPDGRMVTTKASILIGPNYYLGLEKTATDASGVSSSKVSHFGTTARLTNADKYSSPGRQTITRSIDEATARNMSHAMGAEVIAHIMDMNNNPVVHAEVCREILTAEKPTDIERVVDRTKFKMGGHRPLSYAIHKLRCSGKNISRE